jgi:hypothetical protein
LATPVADGQAAKSETKSPEEFVEFVSRGRGRPESNHEWTRQFGERLSGVVQDIVCLARAVPHHRAFAGLIV